MAKPDFTLKFIKEQNYLVKLGETLTETPAFAVDIETVDWWNRRRERIALIQIAFRFKEQLSVAIVDGLADLDIGPLREPLETAQSLKIIHNAGFDATRLAKHYDFRVAPIHDTMLAARRAGERKYSLQAQAAVHLNLTIDKSARLSDWGRRPLDHRQLYYAALDSFSALLLYENQRARNLNGEYRLKIPFDSSRQGMLPLDAPPVAADIDSSLSLGQCAPSADSPENELNPSAAAILGIVTELPQRYSPAQLAVSLGVERVGLAGWIIDNRLGRETDVEEETVKMAVANLCERGLVRLTETRRLEATDAGAQIWRQLKSG